MRKESSSNFINEKKIIAKCSLAYTISLVGGRWKPTILWHLLRGKMRYSQLRKLIPDASERVLVAQLRELESDALVRRILFAEVPPRVEYEMTDLGLSLKTLLMEIEQWGDEHK
jgi:DNA-binding HxlR family transcriptional regulator